ncbi:hypothetical protein GLOIN_2v1782174 [Rhizophagus clarus]|uniref:Uncharacterized protein n=1 Tax=Rhizophagus clarus TaxID=94130 RepID=A0A8H3L2I4_9GLOM|nr:hypothetical protein GLOIN_2v1782174 [Rhizophagus clarus]
MAILLHENSWLVFMDDKHQCKIGEPSYPVAAVERGRQVIVSKNKTFQIADYDFMKCNIIPSITMICDIPSELYKILKHQDKNKPYLLFYTDGGPDHRVTYIHIQMALIALYLKLDLDLLVTVRTSPGHSWKNPVERIMSTCNVLEELIKSLQPTIDLIEGIFERLTLKEESFKTFKITSDEDISDCNICKPLKSDKVDFSQVHSLPDPIPTIDKTSYKEFSEIYGTIITEQHQPSLKHQ